MSEEELNSNPPEDMNDSWANANPYASENMGAPPMTINDFVSDGELKRPARHPRGRGRFRGRGSRGRRFTRSNYEEIHDLRVELNTARRNLVDQATINAALQETISVYEEKVNDLTKRLEELEKK